MNKSDRDEMSKMFITRLNFSRLYQRSAIIKSPALQGLAVILGAFLIFVGFNTASMSCNSRDNEILRESNGMSEILVTSPDLGRTFEVNRGDVIVIRLEENLATGYRWEIGVIDSTIVEFADSNSSEDSETSMGSGGTRTFRFRAMSSGIGQIQLRLRRSWEPVDAAIERFEVKIRVQ